MKRPNKPVLKPHTYDGIQEYDQRLPNWWLYTLYGAILFSIAYWFYYNQSLVGSTDVQSLERQLAIVEQARLAGAIADLDDNMLWKISRNPDIIAAGKEVFTINCASCHGENLKGGIGVNLVDSEWIHGSNPMQIFALIKEGYAPKGMPTWGPVLGDKKIAEVAAYILSHHMPPDSQTP
jgi:cytochrome c oxidase cbb3-type subunit 3